MRRACERRLVPARVTHASRPRGAAPATFDACAVLAALFTVAIWANFLISTGAVVQSGLGIVEVGLLRSVACSLALLPVLWRMGVYPKGLGFGRFLVMTVGAGIGFMALMPLGSIEGRPVRVPK